MVCKYKNWEGFNMGLLLTLCFYNSWVLYLLLSSPLSLALIKLFINSRLFLSTFSLLTV